MAGHGTRVVLITGASSGIGAAVAREYARQGAGVVLAARRLERLESLAEELGRGGAGVVAAACDVTRDGDLEAVVEQAHSELGPIDTVVANAGFGVGGRLVKLDLEDYRRQVETNVFGVLRTVYATLDDLQETRGCLAIVGSVNSYIALPRVSAYCMSKFAVRALAGSLRHELRASGIGVVFIAPGFVDSEIRKVDNRGVFDASRPEPTPGWLRMPADVAARKIARAIRRRKREYVFTAHGKAFVWLERHAPGLLHGLIGRFAAGTRRRS